MYSIFIKKTTTKKKLSLNLILYGHLILTADAYAKGKYKQYFDNWQ